MSETMKNINDATREEIAALPFIGEQRAEMVVHYREVHGPYKSVVDIEKVTGMNERLANRIAEYFEVSDPADKKRHTAVKS